MESQHRLFQFSIDQTAATSLSETGRWSRFLSVIAFIFIALMALGGIFGASILSGMGNSYGSPMPAGMGVAMGLVYLVIAALYLYPTVALYRFGKLISPALNNQDQQLFNEALRHLRNVFKFMGMLTLVVLGIYALIIVFAIIGAAIGAM